MLYGTEFWRDVLDFHVLARYGTISPDDVDLFFLTDSVDETFDYVTRELSEHAMELPGAIL